MTFSSLFGERLKKTRKALGLSQAEVADAVGVSREYWGRCERGASIPGGEVLAALATKGADVNYILTGQESAAAPSLDTELLTEAITLVEQLLAKTGRVFTPAKKAKHVVALYQAFSSGQDAQLIAAELARAA